MNFFLKMWREILVEKTAQWCSGARRGGGAKTVTDQSSTIKNLTKLSNIAQYVVVNIFT